MFASDLFRISVPLAGMMVSWTVHPDLEAGGLGVSLVVAT